MQQQASTLQSYGSTFCRILRKPQICDESWQTVPCVSLQLGVQSPIVLQLVQLCVDPGRILKFCRDSTSEHRGAQQQAMATRSRVGSGSGPAVDQFCLPPAPAASDGRESAPEWRKKHDYAVNPTYELWSVLSSEGHSQSTYTAGGRGSAKAYEGEGGLDAYANYHQDRTASRIRDYLPHCVDLCNILLCNLL